MIRTQIIPCHLPQTEADALNRESARHYNAVLVNHWRTYRKKGVWLSKGAAYRWEDRQNEGTTLHAHSRDAAQEGFHKACKTAWTLRKNGDPDAKYPYHRRHYRTTVWKNTGIRVKNGTMSLACAKGLPPVLVSLPAHLTPTDPSFFAEVRLVYNIRGHSYEWHLVINDEMKPEPTTGQRVLAVDMGEIHPAVVVDDEQAVVFSCRYLRSSVQYRNKRLAEIAQKQSRCKKKGRRYWRLQRRKNRFKDHMRRRIRDIEHKVSHAIVNHAIKREAGVLVIGDVRDIGDGVDKSHVANQKIAQWGHGTLRRYVTYKSEQAGIPVMLQEESYTSQTCPMCGEKQKPRGRVYACRACGFKGHRDVVGGTGIRSKFLYGEIGKSPYPAIVKYRRPFSKEWRRSRADTSEMALEAEHV